MGDPVTMAMIGAGVGAMTNRRNPLQGALMGGALGGFGGSFAKGALTAGNTASTAAMTGAKAVPVGASGVTALNPSLAFNAAQPMAAATMPTYAATGGTTGLIGSTTAPVAMADRFAGGMNALKSDLSDLGSFAKQNPMVAGQGLQAAGNVLFPEPMAAPTPQGLLRGTPSQEQPPQYAMGMPQINLLG